MCRRTWAVRCSSMDVEAAGMLQTNGCTTWHSKVAAMHQIRVSGNVPEWLDSAQVGPVAV